MYRKHELLTCTFDNGVRPCIATVYNFYHTLAILGFLQFAEMPSSHTLCWIRDYRANKTIVNLAQLTEKIQKNASDLRISFFSQENLNGLKKVTKLANQDRFPIVSHKQEAPLHLKVFTIWWHNGKPRIVKSGINSDPDAVVNLFHRVQSGYVKHYMWDPVDIELEKDMPDGYSSQREESAD